MPTIKLTGPGLNSFFAQGSVATDPRRAQSKTCGPARIAVIVELEKARHKLLEKVGIAMTDKEMGLLLELEDQRNDLLRLLFLVAERVTSGMTPYEMMKAGLLSDEEACELGDVLEAYEPLRKANALEALAKAKEIGDRLENFG